MTANHILKPELEKLSKDKMLSLLLYINDQTVMELGGDAARKNIQFAIQDTIKMNETT